jgi:riboflavin synthase
MFTGIIAAIGTIQRVYPAEDGVQIDVLSNALDLSDVEIGDSIALNGACMTVVRKTEHVFTVDVSSESLRCTVGLNQQGKQLNLEKALRFGDRLDGHLVSGHVDGVGHVLQFEAVGESHHLLIQAPSALAKYLAVKGSIVVNGVSLTINGIKDTVDGCVCSINLIPHTLQVTTLKDLQSGDQVNLEVDLLARYIERMMYSEKAL